MVSLPPPRITQAGTNFLTGQQLGRQQGFEDQDRQTMMTAGNLAAGGDLSGASKALFKGGQFDKGMATKNAISKMSDDNLARTLQVQDRLARLAGTIETPEQFEMAKERLRSMGLPVPKGLTFEQLPQLRAEALSVADQMTIAMKERKLAQKATQNRFGKPPSGYNWNEDGSLSAIPGGPATKIPAADAAKIAALQTAEKSFEDAKSFYEKSDFVDRGNQMLNRGKAGRAERTVRLAVESALRAMTGAAAPDSEVESYMNLFGPSAWDTPATARDKLDRLQDFLANLRANIEQGRGPALGAPTQVDGMPPQTQRLRYNPETGELE